MSKDEYTAVMIPSGDNSFKFTANLIITSGIMYRKPILVIYGFQNNSVQPGLSVLNYKAYTEENPELYPRITWVNMTNNSNSIFITDITESIVSETRIRFFCYFNRTSVYNAVTIFSQKSLQISEY